MVGCAGMLAALPAAAQEFSVPRMEDEDPSADEPPPRGNKRGRLDEDDPHGAQDDGTTADLTGGNKRVRKDGGAPAVELTPDASVPSADASRPAPPPAPADAGAALPPPPPPRVDSLPPPPPPVDMPPPTGAAAGVLRHARQSVVLTPATYEDLLAEWEKRRALLKDSPAAAQKQLLNVLSALRALGGGAPGGAQAPDIATALVMEAHELADKLEADRALAVADVAVAMAPSLPATHLALARARYLKAPGDTGPVAAALWGALQAETTDLRFTIRWLLAAAVALVGTLFMMLLGLAATLGLRRLNLLAHDAGHILPVHMRGGASTVLAATLLCIPLVLRAGPVAAGIWFLLVMWRYFEGAERALAALAILCTAALPLGINAAAPLVVFPTTHVAALYLGQSDAGQARAVRPRVDEAPVDAVSLGVSGLMHKRAGDLAAARSALEHALRLEPKAGWTHVNLGCVYASMGEMDRAQMEFERAAELNPADALALHNAATLHALMGRTGAAREAWEAAERVNHQAAQAYRDRAAGSFPKPHNVAFVDAPAPAVALLAAALQPTPASDAVAAEAWAFLSPQVTRALWPGVVLLALLLLALAQLLSTRWPPATACRRCGSPACRSCDGKDVDRFHCAQCYNAFMVRGARVEAALKIRKDVQIRRHRNRRQFLTRLLSALWGGAGLLFAGFPVRGAVLGFLFTLAALIGGASVFLPDAVGVGPDASWVRMAVPALVLILTWLVGLLLSFRSET
ncbi:MAG: hypothetical protein HY904_16680 [Deltaproteobacteria bacterium]|nr:hypothetical protein [Deltaproteobacteria bacterium]